MAFNHFFPPTLHPAPTDKASDPHKVLRLASQAIQKWFDISETTMQIEEYVTEMDDCIDCKTPQ